MTKVERRLAAYLLDMASDKFHEFGCNDMDQHAFDGMTEEEKLALESGFNAANSFGMDTEDYTWIPLDCIPDDLLMTYMADRLMEEA